MREIHTCPWAVIEISALMSKTESGDRQKDKASSSDGSEGGAEVHLVPLPWKSKTHKLLGEKWYTP